MGESFFFVCGAVQIYSNRLDHASYHIVCQERYFDRQQPYLRRSSLRGLG